MMTAQPPTPDLDLVGEQVARDLRIHLALCQEALALSGRENQALAAATGYDPFVFFRERKTLMPRLEASLMALRKWRRGWRQVSPAERADCTEISALFQSVQSVLMKVLLLDRENQQALLRHGMLPPGHLPPAAAQQPHCVASLYLRHARG